MKVVRTVAIVLASLCLAWALALLVTGGFDAPLFGHTLSSHDARRPVLFGSVALTLYILTGGPFRLPWHPMVLLRRVRLNNRWVSVSLAAATFATGMAYGTMAVGGSDAYGYVSEADLFLAGKLRITQAWVEQAPWPAARWSFAPLGYRPQEGRGQWDILPTYAPGLPLLMAGAKLIAGHCAVYAVVPLLGAVAVLATFGIGRRLGTPRAGMIAAWLVATSPAFLFMLMAPMSDVAVTGVWTAALFFLLGRRARSATAAGLLTALAILIRPNLVFLAPVLGSYYLLRAWQDAAGTRWRHIGHAAIFGGCSAIGMLIIAGLNWHLRGTPFESGYGGLGGMFAASHVLPNIRNYALAFARSQTPVEALGLVALWVPVRWLWPGVSDRSFLAIGGVFVFAVFVHYSLFLVFDAWWYLRFLLPCWPLIMLGLGSAAVAVMERREPLLTAVVAVSVVVLGAQGYVYASNQFVFELWKGDHKYVSVAKFVRGLTDENSVVIAMQHTGSIRYYGGRMTLRFDGLEPRSFDTAVNWLKGRGVHVYAALEEWEIPMVKERFAGQKQIAAFDAPPVFVYEGPGQVSFFDLQRPPDPTSPITRIVETYQGPRCVPPVAAPHLVFKP